MAGKKKKTIEAYETLAIKVNHFDCRMSAGVNYELHDERRAHDETRVYRYDSDLTISGICTYPKDRENHQFHFTIMGEDHGYRNHDLSLKQCHALDEDGDWIYKKVRGREEPVYDLPDGIGTLEKERGEPVWRSWIWVPLNLTNQILTTLNTSRELYIEVHEKRLIRRRWVVSLSLQTENPLG